MGESSRAAAFSCSQRGAGRIWRRGGWPGKKRGGEKGAYLVLCDKSFSESVKIKEEFPHSDLLPEHLSLDEAFNISIDFDFMFGDIILLGYWMSCNKGKEISASVACPPSQ